MKGVGYIALLDDLRVGCVGLGLNFRLFNEGREGKERKCERGFWVYKGGGWGLEEEEKKKTEERRGS
jgi:hypothetical protein